ncbi:MAG: rhodanese-related sulfurtransferase [Sediminicola sp.]|jgi:rhodanese-related sulfurtransferase
MSFLSTLFKPKSNKTDLVKILNLQEFRDAIKNNKMQLIDVRTSQEYKGGHIKNAMNIDFFNGEAFRKTFEKLNKEEPVYVYCRSGNRSQKAATRLVGMGFKKTYNLKGGFMEWERQ